MDPLGSSEPQMLFHAFTSLLGEKAFDLFAVQDSAERSTLNRATFYDHFTDKFALLEAMTAESFGGDDRHSHGRRPKCNV
jgi:AcrR family transcriptional regulator